MKLVGSREAVRSPEFHKKRIRQKVWRITIILVSALLLVGAPVLALRDPAYQVREVKVVGNQVTKTEDIQNIVNGVLHDNYLGVIPKSNNIIYPKKLIRHYLYSKIPRLSNVNIALSSATDLTVSVSEREPYALYCETKCYFLDDIGYIFSEAPSFSNGVYLTYKSNPELTSPIGQSFLPEADFKDLDGFIHKLSNLNINPEVLNKVGDEYTLSLKEGPVLRFRTGQDLNTLYTNLSSFLVDPSTDKLNFSSLEYLDLRFDNKIYYK